MADSMTVEFTDASRYPLSWPVGWKRTPPGRRVRARFSGTTTKHGATRADGSTPSWRQKRELSVYEATNRLQMELARLGADREVLSTNIPVRLDGMPRSNSREPEDPGVAAYFYLKGKPRALACDKWDRVADNVAAIAAHVEAIRAVDRYGVGTLEQAFAGYAALPPDPASDWRLVLQLTGTPTPMRVTERYRELARAAHPDTGGSHDEMARLNAARDAALKELHD